MDVEREGRGLRVILMIVVVALTIALSFELLCESHQARLDAAWRRHRNAFESHRRHKQQDLARHLAAGDATAEDLTGWAEDVEM